MSNLALGLTATPAHGANTTTKCFFAQCPSAPHSSLQPPLKKTLDFSYQKWKILGAR